MGVGFTEMSSTVKLAVRLARHGCTNRPFYHIQVIPLKHGQHDTPIEQLGVYDPMPNENNEKLISFNFERMKYWLAQDVQLSQPVVELLGLCGYFPIHPRTYMTSWKNRFKERLQQEKQQTTTE